MASIEEIDTNNKYKEQEDETKSNNNGVEKKLGELLMRGWRMLAESCPKESKNKLKNNKLILILNRL